MSTEHGDQYSFILLHKEASKRLSWNEEALLSKKKKKIYIFPIVGTTSKVFISLNKELKCYF
jgi:hypothetical protein